METKGGLDAASIQTETTHPPPHPAAQHPRPLPLSAAMPPDPNHFPAAAPDPALPRAQRWAVSAALAALLGVTALGMHRGQEFWPVSFYPMFAGTRLEARVDHVALRAVPADGSAAFPLFRSEQLHPYGWYRHRRALRRLLDGAGGVPAARVALADTLRRYEQGRRRGRHDGPPLRALRLERVDDRLEPSAPGMVRSSDRVVVTEVQKAAEPAGEGGADG